jgi:hypothetical protein
MLNILEAIFVIRLLRREGENVTYLPIFEDQAESSFLADSDNTTRTPWIFLIYRNLRDVLFYQLGINGEFFQYETRAGSKIPLALKIASQIIGFDFCPETEPSRSQMASAQSFLSRYPNAKVIFLHLGDKSHKKLKERIYRIPIETLLFS